MKNAEIENREVEKSVDVDRCRLMSQMSKKSQISNFKFQILFLILIAVTLLGTAHFSHRLLQSRHAIQHEFHTTDVPPMVTFTTVALGGFSGIIVDFLWLRMMKLQEQGRFLELMQLAEWITTLEPRNSEIWAYHAWNLSYNVSVMMSRPEDRWRWVLSGIELLRDKGLRLNPGDARLYRELAWIFQHKLGMDMDAASTFYREQWAAGISPFLGESGSVQGTTEQQHMGLQEHFSMNATAMLALEEQFGTLDWRSPLASAVYWGMQGAAVADARELLACRRIVYQSLALMIRDGHANLLEGTLVYLAEVREEHPFKGVEMAYGWLLLDAVGVDWANGNEERARERYARAMEILGGEMDVPTFEEAIQ